MYSRIIVPLDGSEQAGRALPHAEALASRLGASLTILRATLSPSMLVSAEIDPAPLIERDRLDAGEYTVALEERLRYRGLSVATEIPPGPAAAAIIEEARQVGATLIVMTTHGRSGLGRAVYGSVADEVLRKAPCPLLLVPLRGDDPGDTADGITPLVPAYAHVLVALDGSKLAEQVLPHVEALAEGFGSVVTVLRASSRPSTMLTAVEQVRLLELDRRETAAYLSAVAERLQAHGVGVATANPVGPAPAEILEATRQIGADLIAMTTRGWGRLGRLVLGSVAEAVLRDATCPILLVRERPPGS